MDRYEALASRHDGLRKQFASERFSWKRREGRLAAQIEMLERQLRDVSRHNEKLRAELAQARSLRPA